MRINNFSLAMLRIPLVTPFRTSLRTVDRVEDVVVMLGTECGAVGYGSAPATAAITGDTHEMIIKALRDDLAPMVAGKEIAGFSELLPLVQGASSCGSARAALEIALYDLFAQYQGAPLYKILGGGPGRLQTGITISVDSADKMLADASLAIAQGFELLKIKVGGEPDEDIERVSGIFRALGQQVRLYLDANQGWTAEQAIRVITALEQRGVILELVEQPVTAADLDGLCRVSASVRTQVMADESVFSPADAQELIRRDAADIFNIKLMKAGGITAALEIADLAGRHGVPCMMGCMLESPIATAAAAHVAAARSGVITRVDLDAPVLCDSNPILGGTQFSGASITLNQQPGLGIEGIEGLELL